MASRNDTRRVAHCQVPKPAPDAGCWMCVVLISVDRTGSAAVTKPDRCCCRCPLPLTPASPVRRAICIDVEMRSALQPRRHRCRVDPGGCPPGPPTDPDVQNSRIRLFRRMGSLHDSRSSGRPWVVEAGSASGAGRTDPRTGTGAATFVAASNARPGSAGGETHREPFRYRSGRSTRNAPAAPRRGTVAHGHGCHTSH